MSGRQRQAAACLYTAVCILLSALPALAAEPILEIQAPAAGGVSYSDPLIFDLRDPRGLMSQIPLGAVDDRDLEVLLDGRLMLPQPKRPGLPGQWISRVDGLPPGPHQLSINLRLATGSWTQHIDFSHRSQPPLERVTALAEAFSRRYPAESLGWDWGEGLLLYAMARLDRARGETRFRPYLERYYRHHLAQGLPEIDWSDKCAPGLAALELWRETGNPAYREIGERIATYLRTARRTQTGALNHFGNWWPSAVYPESIWVDSLVMYGIFAARWGAFTQDQAMTDFAAEQAEIFARYLQQPNGLWKHAWYTASHDYKPAQPIYWLRGNGWAMAGLPEILSALPSDHPRRQALIESFARTATALRDWQDISGLWHGLLNRPGELYLETSGSALIAYGLLSGSAQGSLPQPWRQDGERALYAVLDRLESRPDGPSMPGISDATMPYERFGYSLIPLRNDKPYGVAAVILAALAL